MFARTERLLLRPGWAEDAPALFRAIADEAIIRNLATAPWPYTMADAESFLARDRSEDEAALLLFRRTEGAPQLVGAAGFGKTPEGDTEIGYWIARPYWGLGFATEAARAVIDIAGHALRLQTLHAGHFTDNPASGRVLEKVGFKPTGQIMQRYSAGRRTAAPCRLLTLDLKSDVGAEVAAEADVPMPISQAFCLAA